MTPMPLSEFPEERRREILRLVALPEPPPKWLALGHVSIVSRAYIEWYRQRGVDIKKKRPRLEEHLRAAVIERDGLVCGICLDAVELDDVHIDHVIAVAKGGPTIIGNLRVTHSVCNLRKGAS